jgi:hypothetical protein
VSAVAPGVEEGPGLSAAGADGAEDATVLPLGWNDGAGVICEVPQAAPITATTSRIDNSRPRRRLFMGQLCQAKPPRTGFRIG